MPTPHFRVTSSGLWLVTWLLATPPAFAQATPVPSGTSVQLRVGQTKVLNVGMAIGLECNDETVVHAELRPASSTENQLVLTGMKPGKTACRAGTADIARSKLVTITVTKQAAQPPP
jgi:hypothetical protein